MRPGILTATLIGLLLLTSPAFAQDNPCAGKADNPCSKKAKNPCGKKADNPCAKTPARKSAGPVPAVDPEYAGQGTVFIVNDPVKRNAVSFGSTAPLEDFIGTTNQVYGYIVFDPAHPDRGVKGEFRIPVKSLDTGIPLRNEHLQGKQWLDAAKYPDITLKFESATNVRLVKKGEGFQTYRMTLSGGLTMHGVTRRMTIPIRVTHLVESEKTRTRMPGDLLAGRAEFSVRLSNFKVKGMKGVVGSKVGETIDLKVSVMGSAPTAAGNPCAKNPCAGKADNPCAKNSGSKMSR